MHCTTGSIEERERALENAATLLTDDTVDLEALAFVFDGDGVKGVRSESAVADRIRELLSHDSRDSRDSGDSDGTSAPDGPRVEVFACANSLESHGVDDDDLVPGVHVVSSGVGELTRRQADGYAYIRVP